MDAARRDRDRAVALRLRAIVVAWHWENTRRDEQNVTAFIGDLIENTRTTSRLPLPLAEVLHQDAAALGLRWRLDVQHVLGFEQVRAKGPAFDPSLLPARTGPRAGGCAK